MKASKKILASAVALVMAAVLSACGKDEASSVHDYTYVALSGAEYTGTYTGGWENGQPNGEGSFSGEGEKGSFDLMGNWSNGQPNGQCRRILKADTYVQTYSGDYFYGEWKGNGTLKIEDSEGNLTTTYTGEFQDGKFNGSGKIIKYYTDEWAAEHGYDRTVYEGQFADGNRNGEGEMTFYYTSEYAVQYGEDHRVYKGQFVDGSFTGEGELAIYYTAETAGQEGIEHIVYKGTYSEGYLSGEAQKTIYYTQDFAGKYGFDCKVNAGHYTENGFAEPYRYALYKNGKAIEEGRVRDGKYISDADKALNDSIYDGLRGLAGDGIWGDLFDMIAPEIYDRNAE